MMEIKNGTNVIIVISIMINSNNLLIIILLIASLNNDIINDNIVSSASTITSSPFLNFDIIFNIISISNSIRRQHHCDCSILFPQIFFLRMIFSEQANPVAAT